MITEGGESSNGQRAKRDGASRSRSIEDLSSAEREVVQDIFLKRWLSLNYPTGYRRRMDHPRETLYPHYSQWPRAWKQKRTPYV